MTNYGIKDSTNTFNSPFEVGLRTLIILAFSSSEKLDLQRIIYYDYLVVHTKDVGAKNSPPSLHPDTPHRSGEIIVKRQIVQQGLELMYSKSLLDIIYDENGISYSATKLTVPFLDLFESTYFQSIKENVFWVDDYFSKFTEFELTQFMDRNIENWGGEFMYESYIRRGFD